MTKFHRILWEKDPFKILVNFLLVYAIKTTFYPILLKLAQIVCIIVRISSIENDEICQTLWEKILSNSFEICID